MEHYALTGRGKFIVITVIVTTFFILPAIIIAIWALGRDTGQEIDNGLSGVLQNGDSTVVSDPAPESTPDLSEIPQIEDNDNDEPMPAAQLPFTPLVSFDLNAGEMVFLFAPGMQTLLDDNTAYMIGTLLASPKNTDDAIISVEIPQLPDDETITLTTAITNTFTELEIPLSDIVFFVYHPEDADIEQEANPQDAPIEVTISLQNTLN